MVVKDYIDHKELTLSLDDLSLDFLSSRRSSLRSLPLESSSSLSANYNCEVQLIHLYNMKKKPSLYKDTGYTFIVIFISILSLHRIILVSIVIAAFIFVIVVIFGFFFLQSPLLVFVLLNIRKRCFQLFHGNQ